VIASIAIGAAIVWYRPKVQPKKIIAKIRKRILLSPTMIPFEIQRTAPGVCYPLYNPIPARSIMTKHDESGCSGQTPCKHPIPINISFFNTHRSVSAHIVDHSRNEICFISKQSFLQGTPVIFRIDYKSMNAAHNRDIEKLPSINVGEISSCSGLSSESSAAFKVGVKIYPQPY
jgi:hypothetical protein